MALTLESHENCASGLHTVGLRIRSMQLSDINHQHGPLM